MRFASSRMMMVAPAAVFALALVAAPADAATSLRCNAALSVRYGPALHAAGPTAGRFTGFGSGDCSGTFRNAGVSGSATIAEDGSRGPGVCGADQGEGTLSLVLPGAGSALASIHYASAGLGITLSGSTAQGEQVTGQLTMPFSSALACASGPGLGTTSASGTIELSGG